MDTVLVIDDNDDFRETICNFLTDAGYAVWEAACPEDAFTLLHRDKFDVILCDLHMPFTMGKKFYEYQYSYEVGLRTIEELEWVFPNTPIVAMSAMPKDGIKKIRRRIDKIPLLPKPFSADDLVEVIQALRNSGDGQLVQ